ncbi:MAG: hypothetical protein ACWGNV_18160 [Bacteroidales bacterium]
MNKSLHIHQLLAITLSLSVMFLMVSCDKEPVDERPELPFLGSLLMDFSDFNQPTGGSKSSAVTYENFLHASISVLFWNVVTTTTLAVPVAAYTYALQQDPEYLGDHTWEWSFDFDLDQKSYTATLTAVRINNEEFSMEMVISVPGTSGSKVKWFDGVVRYDHTHAIWNLYNAQGVKILEAEWNKNFETGEGDLTYTFVEQNQDETGSYITYAEHPEAVFDASYTISLAQVETFIEWNSTSIEGRVKDLVKFGDSDWHCWDSKTNGLVDMVCE